MLIEENPLHFYNDKCHFCDYRCSEICLYYHKIGKWIGHKHYNDLDTIDTTWWPNELIILMYRKYSKLFYHYNYLTLFELIQYTAHHMEQINKYAEMFYSLDEPIDYYGAKLLEMVENGYVKILCDDAIYEIFQSAIEFLPLTRNDILYILDVKDMNYCKKDLYDTLKNLKSPSSEHIIKIKIINTPLMN